MATLEDKILGDDRRDNYCSSSEDEDESPFSKDAETTSRSIVPGQTINSGPKGVMEDWRRYKQLQVEQRQEDEKEMAAMAKKLTLTCRTYADDEKAKIEEEALKQLDEEFIDDDDRAFMREYMRKRIAEIRDRMQIQIYGQVYELESTDQYLKAADEDSKFSTVIIHLYEPNISACEAMNGCFQCLANENTSFKFCKVRASLLNTTEKFQRIALPTIQAYRNGQLVANIVQVSNELGDDFFANDVASLLHEYGVFSDAVTLQQNQKDLEDD